MNSNAFNALTEKFAILQQQFVEMREELKETKLKVSQLTANSICCAPGYVKCQVHRRKYDASASFKAMHNREGRAPAKVQRISVNNYQKIVKKEKAEKPKNVKKIVEEKVPEPVVQVEEKVFEPVVQVEEKVLEPVVQVEEKVLEPVSQVAVEDPDPALIEEIMDTIVDVVEMKHERETEPTLDVDLGDVDDVELTFDESKEPTIDIDALTMTYNPSPDFEMAIPAPQIPEEFKGNPYGPPSGPPEPLSLPPAASIAPTPPTPANSPVPATILSVLQEQPSESEPEPEQKESCKFAGMSVKDLRDYCKTNGIQKLASQKTIELKIAYIKNVELIYEEDQRNVTKDRLEKLTFSFLKKFAKLKKYKNYSKYNKKGDLIEFILEHTV